MQSWVLLALLGLLSATGFANPQPSLPSPHIRYQAEPVRTQPGARATLRIRALLDSGWHTFPATLQMNEEGMGPSPLRVESAAPGELRLQGPARVYPLESRYDTGFQMPLQQTQGDAWIELPIQVPTHLPPGIHLIPLQVTSQVCNSERCLPASRQDITVELWLENPATVVGGQGSSDRANHPPAPSSSPKGSHPGMLAFLWLAAIAGATSLITPCVLPMIPITVSFFTQRSEQDRKQLLRNALVFGLGIIMTFSGLGLILTLFFGATGIQSFATNPVVNLALALLFIGFALNLFGAIQFRAPGALLSRLTPYANRQGTFAVLLMGLVFSLTSFTCTVPFVGSALLAASQGAWFHPLLGMLVYSSVFALPFVLLACFPSLLARLPRSGAWMHRLKVVLGFLELAAALKFLSNADLAWGLGLLKREGFLALWAACAGLIAIYLFGILPLRREDELERPSLWRAAIALGFTAVGVFLLIGMSGKSMGELEAFLPPIRSTKFSKAPAAHESGWYSDYQLALSEAKRSGRPIFLDFTGYTCTNCRWMEQNMFPRPAVARQLDRFIRVRLHTDRSQEPELSNRRLQLEQFKAIELPLYAVLSPEAQILGTRSFTRDEKAFVAFLVNPSSESL